MEKKVVRSIAKLCSFVLLTNLPFLTMTQLIGIDTFIDSFNHPNSYQFIKNDDLHLSNQDAGYIILEKPTYQGYVITEGDIILYLDRTELLQQRIVFQILHQQGVKTYYTTAEEYIDGPIYDQQIIGKIKGGIDQNIWNTFCLQIWDFSIHNLNAAALFSQT